MIFQIQSEQESCRAPPTTRKNENKKLPWISFFKLIVFLIDISTLKIILEA